MAMKHIDVNHTIISGNLVKDIELKKIGSQEIPKINFSIAYPPSFKDKQGEWKEETRIYIDRDRCGMEE